jgi:Protein of unknown function (DUF3179)
MTMTSAFVPSRTRPLWIALATAALAGTAAFFIPAYIIRPFAHQSARGLWWAMAIRQRAPIVSLLCAIVCFGIAALLWKRCNWWRKVLLVVPLLFATFSAVMSRLNYFEWMFHPVESAKFDAESASKLDKSEMILAVSYGADARAYPIREMAYHHVLNDVVEGVPLAVTY